MTLGVLMGGVFDALDLRQELGCGHEGCVYATKRGTVVKVTNGKFGNSEARAAEALEKLKHRIIPRIYGFGTLSQFANFGGPVSWIEREPLNDLQLGEEAILQFVQGDLGRLLGNAYGAKKMFALPKTIPADERKVLTQIGIGYSWLGAHGFDLQDHNTPDNWGTRADGSVALRDLGHIYVHPQGKS